MVEADTENEYKGSKKALIIAISEYDHLEPLYFCRRDGEQMYKFLTSIGYLIPDARKLIGRIEYSQLRDSIIDFFYDVNIHPTDTVLFYFSGHGIPGDDEEHYFSTSEIDPNIPRKRGFSFDELTKVRQECNSKTIFTILDCCYSGADKPSKGHKKDAAKIGREIISKKSKNPGEGRCILAACKPMQEAYEFKQYGHSFFTFYLLEGLTGANGICVDNEGNVTPELLNEYIDNKFAALPKDIRPKQRPYLRCESAGKIILANHPEFVRHDILTSNELQKANEKLKESMRLYDIMQREFINIAAYELRTPIQPIITFTNILRNKIKNSQYTDLMDAVIRNAERLNTLSENFLDIARIEGQSLILKKEQFELKDLIKDMANGYRKQLKKEHRYNIEILIDSDSNDDIVVKADRNRLAQVISNLLNNSLQFTKEGVVSLKTEKKDDRTVLLSIKDTGDGIDPEILPRLFTKFVTKSPEGIGLGLYISKSIVEAHRGKIWATNNNRDRNGTTFFVELPIIIQSFRSETGKFTNSNKDKVLIKRVLIVDDVPDITLSFKIGLEQYGYKVNIFNDPERALDHFIQVNQNYYDLVITGIRMPHLNGLQLYFKIKAINPNIKILFVTALDAADDLISIVPGMTLNNLMKKPIRIEDLVKRIRMI